MASQPDLLAAAPPPEEWPIATRPATPPAAAPETVPAERIAQIARIWSSPAVGAFINRRVDQLVRHGYSPADDALRPLDHLVRQAQLRLGDVLDLVGHHARDRHGINLAIESGRLATALRKVEIAGALLLAAHDQLATVAAANTQFNKEEDQ